MSLLLLIGCADRDFLDTGDKLIVTMEPGVIYAGPATGSSGCVESGGAVIRLVAAHGDGNAAANADVQLWVTGPVAATITMQSLTISENGTSESACLLPGATPGTATVHARSGPIEETATIEIRSRSIPAGGTIVVSSAPVEAEPPAVSTCGDLDTCLPAVPRQSRISVVAQSSDSAPVPPEAELVLSTNFGWLSATSCDDSSDPSALEMTLSAGVGTAVACFPDSGATATISARSGTVTSSASVELRAVVRAIDLVPSRARAAEGDALTFSARVSDCSGGGVAAVPVTLVITDGVFELGADSPTFAMSGADGTVTFAGIARQLPINAVVRVGGASQISCSQMVLAGGAS